MLYELLALLVTVSIGIITYFKWNYKYWEKKGIPFIEPRIPFGNGQNPLNPKRPNYHLFAEWYNHFRSHGHKHGGVYIATTRAYMPVDPEIIKCIMTKDFSHFMDRGVYYNEKHDPLSAHLFSIEGQKWRNLRTKITPTFTSGKMKMMFQTVLDCGELFQKHIEKLHANKEHLDIKDILASFTTDVIGSCAFGLEPLSFIDADSEFRKHGRNIFTSNFSRKLRLFFIVLFPNFSKRLGLPIFERSVSNFYFDAVKSMVKYREDNDIKRNDFMQILLELKNAPLSDEGKKYGASGLTMEEIAAQAFVFFLAGFETSSTTMTFCLFELAQNPDIQEKVRREIEDALEKNDGKLTYEGVMELKYMGQVIDETLRKYPVVPTLVRKCVKDYKIPETDTILEMGTRVFISAMGLHFDPGYYPDPEKFDPERFSDDNKAKRHPYTYLPFGEGPRICIGLRFGMMQTRVGLTLVLKNYRLKLSPKTQLPLKMDPSAFLMVSQTKIWLETERCDQILKN